MSEDSNNYITKILVCEGKCNPELREYDQMRERQEQFGDLRVFLAEQARQLVHTEHEMIIRGVWHDGVWKDVWRCVVCRATKRF